MNADFDLIILGSGFGGSLTAMVARRLGLRVLLLERGQHPRFAIGESSSPLANLLLEELAAEYGLPRLKPLAAYGPWKRHYPEVGVGLKRGFTFFAQEAGAAFPEAPGPERRLLVAASPHEEVADTHWYRADFDQFLVREAQALGVEYEDRAVVKALKASGRSIELRVERGGREQHRRCRMVIDATGPRGALHHRLGLPEVCFDNLPPRRALFSHFTGVRRYREPDPREPYPADDSALHHLFDGGWMWVLRFDNGITSAGISVEEPLAADLRLETEGAWERFLDRYPGIAPQFAEAVPVLPWRHRTGLSYRTARAAGPGWLLLPSAAACVDPLFSTGFPLTLLGIQRLGRLLREGVGFDLPEEALRKYEATTLAEADAAARLVGACFAAFGRFEAFVDLSMLYFAAASFSEMARRLGRPELAPGFLLQGDPRFRELFHRHTGAALAGRPTASEAIAADLEPYNVAGLCDPARENLYPVDPVDALRAASKLSASPEEVADLLARLGVDLGPLERRHSDGLPPSAAGER
jgi:tetracycline 7-halogenase / FADH2 O2-dependent halogenase